MMRLFIISLILICAGNYSYSQDDEIEVEDTVWVNDKAANGLLNTPEVVDSIIRSQPLRKNEWIIGGLVNSVFHESIDSAAITISIDGKIVDVVYTREGVFRFISATQGMLLELSIDHPDFHSQDTTILLDDSRNYIVHFDLEPRYKILLRGRVFAGNLPLEDVDVEIKHAGESYRMKTLGCYYDSEDYWNCLYNGMFKFNLTTDNPDDSIQIFLSKDGMKTLKYGLTIHEYQGDIMHMKMIYDSNLPKIPFSNLNLKLGFPFTSYQSDWYLSLSYYRLINNSKLRRLAYGIEGNLFVSNITVMNSTFPGLEPASVDSSYIDGFIGPSVLFWFLPPEKRNFSSYAGMTFACNLKGMKLALQPFLGTRFFLDMNKAISFEVRYTEFNREIVHFSFNPYGSAHRYLVSDRLKKLLVNIGIQIAF
jgi:hypothetical protein